MDNYEATKVVLTKIQSMDPENASKIMGYILIQDLGDKELIRLALGPDTLLVSLINEAKSFLGLGNGNGGGNNNHNPFSQTTPRILIPNNNNNGGLFHHQNQFLNSPSPNGASSSPWFSRNSPRPLAASYASVVNNGGGGVVVNNGSGSSSSSLSLPFYGGGGGGVNNGGGELNEEFVVGNLQFIEEGIENNNNNHFNHFNHHSMMSPSGRSDSMIFPYGNCEEPPNTPVHPHQLHHRRSFSVNDVYLGGGVEDGGGGGVGGGGNGFGWRPCMYYARGFCKNGSNCKFLHGGFDSPDGGVGGGAGGGGGGSSPGKIDGGGFDEFLRIKAIQQQRLAAASQLMASGGGQHPFPYNNKGLTFLNDNQRSAAAAMMMGEEFHKFGRFRPDRSNFASMGLDANSSSRQIYLTFPADSTFKEEDVSTYFSMYGPVQDVRIPYQQKRMFGFVTFVYPETVKLILAKGNPHFVCDSRVLVKPYKEKGKIADKKHQQQQQQLIDQGEFSACLSPTGFDSRESFDHPFGAGIFYNTQEMMLRRKIEERAELQQMIDLQGRRLMGMQMMDTTNHQNNHPFLPSLSPAIPIPSPRQNQSHINQNLMFLSDRTNVEVQEGTNTSQGIAISPTVAANAKGTQEATESSDDNNGSENGNEKENANLKDSDLHESFDHMLPDNLFASPTKSAAENHSLFGGGALSETTDTIPSADTSSNNMPMSSKPCNFETPRFSSGQEAIEM